MVYAVIRIDEDPVQLSVVAAANAIGLLACAIPGGIAADRLPRRLILRAVETANVLPSAPSSWWASSAPSRSPPHDRLARARRRGGFLLPSYSAILPRILPAEHLLPANGLEGAVRPALQQAAGPAMAGLLLAALIPSQAAGAVLLAHAAALVLLLFLRPEPAAEAADAAEGVSSQSIRHDLVGGRAVHGPHPVAAVDAAVRDDLGARDDGPGGGPAAVRHPRALRPRSASVRLLLACFGAGGVVGSVVVSSLRMPRRYLSAMTLVWGLSTLPFVVIGLTHEYWLMAVSGFACGFGFSYGNVIWGTPCSDVSRHMLGRISSLTSSSPSRSCPSPWRSPAPVDRRRSRDLRGRRPRALRAVAAGAVDRADAADEIAHPRGRRENSP
jgi:DHA3 family tetracycline resistance protein-like MFS transporter